MQLYLSILVLVTLIGCHWCQADSNPQALLDVEAQKILDDVGFNSGTGFDAICYGNDQSPCRIRLIVKDLDGNQVHETSKERCGCQKSACPNDWSQIGNVISLDRFSNDYQITVQMMFCKSILPRRFCKAKDNVALQLQGLSLVPSRLMFYRCKCRNNKYFMQKRVEQLGSIDFPLKAFGYVCEQYQNTCRYLHEKCRVKSKKVTTFTCTCPPNSECVKSKCAARG